MGKERPVRGFSKEGGWRSRAQVYYGTAKAPNTTHSIAGQQRALTSGHNATTAFTVVSHQRTSAVNIIHRSYYRPFPIADRFPFTDRLFTVYNVAEESLAING